MSIYNFEATDIDGEIVNFEKYKGKVLIIVNTASKCGFTPQYDDLEKLYKKYKEQGFEILGFPCNQFADQEPGNNSEVKSFCTINYGVTFPIFEKIDVRGKDTHPIFKYLTLKAPYKGIDESVMSGKILKKFLSEELPEYLVGDSIKWNFTKFLIDRDGNIVQRYESPVEPMDMTNDIEALLHK
jgi:glutathione peroxidase